MTKVLLTGGGGAHTHSVLRSLTNLGYEVLSADASLYAVGTAFAKRGFVIPFAVEPAFEQAMRKIVEQERPDFVIPLVDEEIAIVHRLVAKHFAPSVRVVAPRLEFCEATLDKWKMYEQLSAAGLAVAPTWLASDAQGCTYPAIIKPRTGRGSRGLAYLSNRRDLERYLHEAREPHDQYVVQKRIDGAEYTTSAVVALDGKVLAVVPKEVLSKRGITQLGATRINTAIDRLCRSIQQQLRADGPFNVQLMLREDGQPFVFEINPRYSTTSVLTLAAGINEFDEIMRHARGEPPRQLTWEPDLVMIRHATELYVRESEWQPDDLRATRSSKSSPPPRRRVLVTGATGFVGSVLVPRLLAEGYCVTAGSQTREASAAGVDRCQLDLTDADASRRLLSPWRWDAVVNLAAPVPNGNQDWPTGAATVAAHVGLALNLISAIPEWWDGRLIHLSSMTVYGIPAKLPVTEDDRRNPLHHYGLGKRLSEDVIHSSWAPDRWVLRMGGLFSEQRHDGALFQFTRAAVRGDDLHVNADGPLPWDLLHVEDAVEAIVRALRSPLHDPGAINVSYGERVQLVETAEWIAARAKRGSRVVNDAGIAHPPLVIDIGRAKRILEWPPASLADRLDRFLIHHAAEVDP
jgi:carbamoyl-phosphate synthase large subunit